MRTKRRNGHKAELEYLEMALCLNGQAKEEGPKRKSWHMHDLKTIKPLSTAQEELFHAWFNGDHLCAHGSAGTGKAQPLDAKVLTPSGWTTIGEISKGDYVSTPDGKSAKVTGVYPQETKDIFTITFHDGSSTKCCGEHLWEVWYPTRTGYKSEKHIVSTYEILDLIENGTNVAIPLIIPANTVDVNLPLSPYLLGVLLGDGCISQSSILFSTQDEQLLSLVKEELFEEYTISDKTSSPIDYRIVSKSSNVHRTKKGSFGNAYKNILHDLNLLGTKSNTKFIPEIFLSAGLEQRLDLIRGLMDTDGTVNINKRGGRGLSFTTVSEQLATDVQALLWSIGATCSISSRRPTYQYQGKQLDGQVAYTLFISHPCPKTLFRVNRKRDLCLEQFNNGRTTLRRRVSSIELTSHENAQCIMIDHPDHLYITDDYVVTHNTFLAFYLALSEVLTHRQNRIIIVRSAVPTREIGYLPGDLEDKVAQYELPYHDILYELLGRRSSYKDMKDAGLIEFQTTSFVRGLTWDHAIVILEEAQNMTFHEIDNIMTRIGQDTRVIVTGDTKQTDLDGSKRLGAEGMSRAMQAFSNMKRCACVEFTVHDIIRSDFVKSWIMASQEAA